MKSRREAIAIAASSLIGGCAASAVCPGAAWSASSVNRLGAWRRGFDGQRIADLGDGRYLNPVFAGDHPEPAVLRDGSDHYICFASADYYPGPMIWHSVDLLNWAPVGPVLSQPVGSIHGPELVRHGGRYFLYMTVYPWSQADDRDEAARRARALIMVVHADNIAGPWSAPVDLGLLGHCDPAHVVSEDGTRYLFLNNGYRVPLHADGLSGRGTPRQVYRGWPIPSDFINEGFVLDAVKIVRRDGWFYLFAAEGGGAGPANGHLVSVARARSVDGPWHDSPYNPLVRAEARDDPWWSRGRAVPVEGPDGRWWIIYHSYEKNLRSLGRQMILEPIEWRGDGWPRSLGGLLDVPLRAPAPSSNATHGVALGGPWSAQDLGRRVAIYRPGPADARRVSFERGDLLIAGKGDGPATSSPFAMVAGDRRYEMSVRIEPGGQAEAGLLLFYDHQLFCGLSVIDGSMRRYKLGQPMTWPVDSRSLPGPFHMKIVYKEDVASFFLSQDGHAWSKIMTQEVSGYNVNMTDRPLSLRPALFVAGQGSARFSPLHYNGAL